MKPAIPETRTGRQEDRFFEVVKQTLDSITGQQKNATKLQPLASTATTDEIITQLNAILTRIQG